AMVYYSTSGPDPLPPAFPEGGEVFVQPADGTGPSQAQPLPETDLADLTARFAASGGPGLSSELSMELALEIVLHEIVEQTCLATGATGAAIVLERDGRTLEALAGRVLKNLERAAQPVGSTDAVSDGQLAELITSSGSRRALDIVTWALGAIVLVSAVWLGTRAVQRVTLRRAEVQSAPAKAEASGVQVGESVSGRVEGVRSEQ